MKIIDALDTTNLEIAFFTGTTTTTCTDIWKNSKCMKKKNKGLCDTDTQTQENCRMTCELCSSTTTITPTTTSTTSKKFYNYF